MIHITNKTVPENILSTKRKLLKAVIEGSSDHAVTAILNQFQIKFKHSFVRYLDNENLRQMRILMNVWT